MRCFLILLLPILAFGAGPANLPRFQFGFSSAARGTAAIAVAPTGETYIAGTLDGNDLSATPGAYQTRYTGGTCYGGGGFGPPVAIPCHSTFVVKLDSLGNVVFATYLGGVSTPSAIAFDSQGNTYVAGANYGGFAVTPGAAFTDQESASYIVKLNASGSQLAYATLIPAQVEAIAVDAAGNVYFAGGDSYQIPFPTTPGAFQTVPLNSNQNGVVGELNATGTALIFATYLSGTQGPTTAVGIALDAAGNVLVGGETKASDFPATSGEFTGGPAGNLFLANFRPGGGSLAYANLLGYATPIGMQLIGSGEIYLFGTSPATSWPSLTTPFGIGPGGSFSDCYLFHVSADGSRILNTVYLPLSPSSAPGALSVDAGGNAYVLGYGVPPATTGAFQPPPSNSGAGQIMVAKIAPSGQLAGATYAGIQASNSVTVLAAERDGSVTVAGSMAQGFEAANFFPAITVENGASYASDAIVPGEIVTIRGYGIGPEAGVASAGETNLGGVEVYFGSLAAPIFYAQALQINVQVPWELAGQSTTLQITYNGTPVGGVPLSVSTAAPGIFYIENSDGSVNSPSNPAQQGSFISIYGTGAGSMSPQGITGGTWPSAPLSSIRQNATVTIGKEQAYVLYAGSAPTLASGYFQINAALPSDVSASTELLTVTIGSAASVPVAVSVR